MLMINKFIEAIKENNEDKLRLLLADKECTQATIYRACTHAIEYNRVNLIRIMLLEAPDFIGGVQWAVITGNLELVKVLIEEFDDEVVPSDFIRAARIGNLEICKYLLPLIQEKKTEHTYLSALCNACEYGHLAVVKWLVNEQNIPFTTEALMEACSLGRLPIVKFFLEDPNRDPSLRNNMVINATTNLKVIDLLLQDARVREELYSDD